jgi:formylglycine-generating enzyme required for sulfatase activity
VLRGASWYDYDPYRLLASYRRNHTPDRRGADAGFRCVVARDSSR